MTKKENIEQANFQHDIVTHKTTIKLLLDSIPLGLVLLNKKRQVVYSNKLFYTMTKHGDLIGKRPGEIFHCIHHLNGDDGCGTTKFCKNCNAYKSISNALQGIENTEECYIVTDHGDTSTNINIKVKSSKYIIDEEEFILFTIEDISDIKKDEKTLHLFFEYIKSGVVIYRAINGGGNFVIEYFNEMAEKIENVKKENVIGKEVIDAFPGIIEFGLLDVIKEVYKTGVAQDFPISFYTDSVIKGWRENSIFKLPSGEIAVVYIDATEKKKAEYELRVAKDRLNSIFHGVQTAIIIIDPESHTIIDINKKGEEMIGLPNEKIVGNICHKFICPADCGNCPITDLNLQIESSEKLLIRSDGKEIPILKTVVIEMIGNRPMLIESFIDISERKKLEQILKDQSLIDSLSEIGNRRAMEYNFEKVLKHSNRNNEEFSIIMIDIDFFKKYNDEYGHISGDSCIKEIAKTIKANIFKPLDAVFRYGGEEFLVILPNTNKSDVLIVSERLRKAVESLKIPHKLSTVNKFVTISLGAYCKQEKNSMEIKDIIKEADINLYKAKEKGRNGFFI